MTTFALPRQTLLINLAAMLMPFPAMLMLLFKAVKTEDAICCEFLWGWSVVSGGLDLLCGWISGSISLVMLEPRWPIIFFSALNLVLSLCAVYRSIAQSSFFLSSLCLLCFICTESRCALQWPCLFALFFFFWAGKLGLVWWVNMWYLNNFFHLRSCSIQEGCDPLGHGQF